MDYPENRQLQQLDVLREHQLSIRVLPSGEGFIESRIVNIRQGEHRCVGILTYVRGQRHIRALGLAHRFIAGGHA